VALIDDYADIWQNDTEFRQRLTVQFAQTLTSILSGTPTVEQVNLGRLYAQSPDAAINQALPFAGAFILNRSDPDPGDDAQMLTAVEQAIGMLVDLGVGIPA
jgi:hypothetical protein